METIKKDTGRKNKELGVYANNLLSRKVHVPFNNTVGKNIKEILQNQN